MIKRLFGCHVVHAVTIACVIFVIGTNIFQLLTIERLLIEPFKRAPSPLHAQIRRENNVTLRLFGFSKYRWESWAIVAPILRAAFGATRLINVKNCTEADVSFLLGLPGRTPWRECNASITMYSSQENTCSLTPTGEPFSDDHNTDFVDFADVSLGLARYTEPSDMPWADPSGSVTQQNLRAARAANHMFFPYWLSFIVEGHPFFNATRAPDDDAPLTRCRIHHSLSVPTDPERWAQRPGFAAMVVSHYDVFPRTEFMSMFSELAPLLDDIEPQSSGGPRRFNCSCPGFPYTVPNRLSFDKQYFLRDYRFAASPENRRSNCGGYLTEKLGDALVSGAVPLFWGDRLDTRIINPARILVLDPDTKIGRNELNQSNFTTIIDSIMRLETDAAFRNKFFSVPLLQPSANSVVSDICSEAVRLFRSASKKIPRLWQLAQAAANAGIVAD